MAKIIIEYDKNLVREFQIHVDLGMLTGVYTYNDASKQAKSMAADMIGQLQLSNYYANIDFKYCFEPQSAQTWIEAADFEQ